MKLNRSLWFLGTMALLGAVAFGQETQPSDESPAPAATAPVAPVAKAPIPNAAALKKAGDLVNEVYGKEIDLIAIFRRRYRSPGRAKHQGLMGMNPTARESIAVRSA